MIQDLMKRAAQDRPVYLCEVRDAFEREGETPFSCCVTLFDSSTRCFRLRLPRGAADGELAFIDAYVHATLYNILSALGAVRVDIYTDLTYGPVRRLAEGLNKVFQVDLPKKRRTGYGKCLNVNERVLRVLRGGRERFGFFLHDWREEPEMRLEPAVRTAGGSIFARLPEAAEKRLILGIDVGGTDVKLAAAVYGKLVCKEYDWNPAAYETAETFKEPLLTLTRLMRAAASLVAAGREEELDRAAMDRHASLTEILRGAEKMEQAAGTALRDFDAVGLSFPDVVINNRITGGESPKYAGMRENPARDYEAQLAGITGLNEQLGRFVRPGGPVRCANDGPIAAFTAAVEQAAGGRYLGDGFFAHTLGTDLGTGWVLADGTIPDIPLEVYNFIIDLGSFGQRRYPAADARSVCNFGTGLGGSVQRYAGQAGVFRLAAKELPERSPGIWQEAVDRGLFVWEGERLTVPTAPCDRRKECLEFLMERAAGDGACADIFRQVGEALGACWMETMFVLEPGSAERTLFGRLVRDVKCFRLIREGAERAAPGIRLYAADDGIACTGLMRKLVDTDWPVAQFAQAVGAVFFACMPFV